MLSHLRQSWVVSDAGHGVDSDLVSCEALLHRGEHIDKTQGEKL